MLGATPAIADEALDEAGARCQAEALERHAGIVSSWLGEANKAKKRLLKGGKGGDPPAVMGPSELAAGIDAALPTSPALVRAVSKAGAGIAKRCADAQVDGLFDCDDAATIAALTACVVESAEQAACNAFELADALDLACPGDSPP